MTEIDICDRTRRIDENSDLYGRFAQMMSADNDIAASTQMLQKMAETADADTIGETEDALVTYLWTLGEMSEEQYNLFVSYNSRLSTPQTLMLVSGLFLSLWEYFDERKMMLLGRNIHSLDRKVLARSLTYYCLVLFRHEEKTLDIDSIRKEVETWGRDEDIEMGLEEVQRFFRSTCKTKEIFNTFMKEVVPNLTHDLKKDLKGNRALKEAFNKVAIEDADLNVGVFAHMKDHNFFTVLSHWFCPFSLNRRELSLSENQKKMLKLVVDHASVCDLDKYTLTLTFLQMTGKGSSVHVNMPEEIREKLNSPDHEYDKLNMEEDLYYRLTFQTLYRFFTFSNWGAEMLNPFKKLNPDFMSNRILAENLNQEFYLELMDADFDRGNIDTLETILNAYDKRFEDTARSLCYRSAVYRTKDMEAEARECLLKAKEMGDEQFNMWILHQLFECNEELGYYEEAYEHIKALREVNPNNMRNVFEMSIILMKLERYDEALKGFFQLEFENIFPHRVTRAIAWCSLMTHNLDRAQRYYKKLLDWGGKRNWEDVLNAGHTAWLMGDTHEATRLYRAYKDNTENARNVFLADHDLLIRLGISEEDFQKMATLF